MKYRRLSRHVRIALSTGLSVLLVQTALGQNTSQPSSAAAAEAAQALQRKKNDARSFQNMELVTARSFSYIFNPGETPRIIWRDVDEVRRLGSDGKLRVRWFDADLNEADAPKKPGRWGAYIEGKAPNGTPVRRAMTFLCRPPGFLFYFPTAPTTMPYMPGPVVPEVWREHEDEIRRMWGNLMLPTFNDTPAAVSLITGLTELKPLGRPPLAVESASVRNDDYHLALKMKLLGRQDKVRPLAPPRKRTQPAPVLHEGTAAEAGFRPDARARLQALCRQWAEDSKEPFVTLVARNGIIVLHEAFGRDPEGKPVGLDYHWDVFSITKSVTGILFSQFVDQGLIGVDDPVSTVFPDWPQGDPHVPTFRQCLTHMSGLSGHGDWGGVRNPWLDNIVLNGIDVNQPGKAYEYAGMGFDLTAEAMELVTGRSALHLYRDHLYVPLGLGDVPMDSASAGAQFTAFQLGVLGQWLANGGSYGDLEFISPATFEKMLPEPLGKRYPGVTTEEEGLGNHWLRHRKPGVPQDSNRPEHLIFSPRTIGHGSLSSCIFLIDLDHRLVITQIRKTGGPRYGEWSQKFFQAVADGMTK